MYKAAERLLITLYRVLDLAVVALSFLLALLIRKNLDFAPLASRCLSILPGLDPGVRYAGLKFRRGYWRMAVYRRHAGKMVRDTYTPQTLKVQGLIALWSLASLPGLILGGAWGVSLVLAPVCFVAASLPFMGFAMRRDAAVALLAPCFLFVRALAISAGALWFLLGWPFRGSALAGGVDPGIESRQDA